jgi:cryptochrome
MWLSASVFFSAYFRVYSPVAFGKRWSAAPSFIRHYLPVLKNVPDKYIFEPWNMPAAVARTAGVEVGRNYPKRMVDHGKVSKENIGRMAEAYGNIKKDTGVSSPTTASGTKKRPSSSRPDRGRSSKEPKTYKMSK